MKFNNFKACIFDFDGVIIDSEIIHAKAKEKTLNFFNINYPEKIFEMFKGRTDKDFFTHVFETLNPNQISAEVMLEHKKMVYLTLFEDVSQIEGFNEFLLFAKTRFETLGITTSASLHDYSLAINKFQIEKYFDFIITGEDTKKHKPDPEPYLMASKKLNFEIDQTIVIEDSPNGLISARAAGFTVFGITTSFSEQVLITAGASYTVDSYIELEEMLSN